MTSEKEFSTSSTEWSSQVHRLQTAFTEYKIARYSYLEILSIFTNKFATSKAEEYLINYLRVCLQFLITYSIQIGDKEWTLQKKIITFENYAAKLEKVLQIPRMSVSNQFSLENLSFTRKPFGKRSWTHLHSSFDHTMALRSESNDRIKHQIWGLQSNRSKSCSQRCKYSQKTENTISTLQFDKDSFQFSD